MVVRRQRKLMATARRTHAVVASLFPETVQQRILEDAAKKEKEEFMGGGGAAGAGSNHNYSSNSHSHPPNNDGTSGGTTNSKPIGKGSGHGTNQTVSTAGGEFVYGSAPIADFFQSTTILFSDLAGFTAWSSTKEPTQVFQLLEKIYCTFDELARSQGVFKVR
jgi:Adenylate and Guanylate cyclase catalytic domain